MTPRRPAPPKARPASWDVTTETKLNGRLVVPGTELTVQDHGGGRVRLRFIELVAAPAGSWVTGYELDRHGQRLAFRSFDPSRVLTVHVKKRSRLHASPSK